MLCFVRDSLIISWAFLPSDEDYSLYLYLSVSLCFPQSDSPSLYKDLNKVSHGFLLCDVLVT